MLLEHDAAPQAPLTAALEQARYAGVPEPRLHALAELLRAHRRAAASHGPPLQAGAGRSARAEPPTAPAEHRRSLSWHGPISARAAPAAACAACAALAAARRPCTAACTAACAAACTAACAAACAAAAPRPANASRQAAEAAAEEAASSLLAEVESERCVEAARAQARAARLAKRAQARAAPGLRAERGSGSSSSSGSGRCEDEGACEAGTSTSTSEAKARPASAPAAPVAPAAPAGPGIAQRLQARYGWRCELIGSALFFDGSDVDIVIEVPHSSSLAHAYEKVVLATGWVVAGTGTVDGQRL